MQDSERQRHEKDLEDLTTRLKEKAANETECLDCFAAAA